MVRCSAIKNITRYRKMDCSDRNQIKTKNFFHFIKNPTILVICSNLYGSLHTTFGAAEVLNIYRPPSPIPNNFNGNAM